jgi:hypothetical protein
MAGRNGQELLSAWVPSDLAAAFRAWARAQDGGASAALRGLVAQAVTGEAPAAPPGPGAGYRLTVRLQEAERAALLTASKARGVTPSTWVRALAVAHLARKPQWNPAEVDALRDLFAEVRRIGANVNQVARALNVAVARGEYPPRQGEAAREAAELVRSEMRRVVAVMSGNWDYWGLPWADRPMPAPGAEEREDERTRAEMDRRRLRPRRRPKRFVNEEEGGRARVVPEAAGAGQPEAGPPLQDAGKAALAEVMRRYDEGQRAQQAAAEMQARTVLSQREQAGAPLLPKPAQEQVQP